MATYANQVLRSFWTFYLGPTFFSCSLFWDYNAVPVI
jgi:hypothetical protein